MKILLKVFICIVLIALSVNTSMAQVQRITIAAGDNITITVYDEADLNGTFAVKEDGTITYPLLNVVKVEGLTRGELEVKLVELLKDGYLVNPVVTVDIVYTGRKTK